MGSTKFKLNGHRGNNKPFSQLTSRGLIGASMNDTDGYSQPDYGSSMYDDGASEGEAGSNYTRKQKRILRKTNKCVKGVDGGDFCETPGGDDSSTRKSKGSRNEKNYLVEDKLNKTTTKNAVQLSYRHGGISEKTTLAKGEKKLKNSKDEKANKIIAANKGRKGTEAAAKSTPLKKNATKKDIVANEQKVKQKYLNQKGANKYNTSSKTFDKNFEQAEKNTVGSEKTLSRYKKVTKKKNAQALSKGRDFKNDKFKKSVTTKRGNDTGKVGNSLNPRDKNFGKSLTGTTKTKAKLIGKGNKTKSFKLEGTEGSGKAVSAKISLEIKNDRFTKQVRGRIRNTTGVDKETKSSRTENRKMNQRKNANQGLNQGSLTPTETSRKTSGFNRARTPKAKSVATRGIG